MSIPFSNLNDASDLIPNPLAVFLIKYGLKNALSSATFFVSASISEFSPPIMPAIATGPALSHIIRSFEDKDLSTPSSVRKTVGEFVNLTSMLFPLSLS